MNYVQKLEELKFKRQKTKKELMQLKELVKEKEQQIVFEEYRLKVEHEQAIRTAPESVIKTKYSNAERRKLEYDKLRNSSETLNTYQHELVDLHDKEIKLDIKNEIEKLEERYIFKQIEVTIGEKYGK